MRKNIYIVLAILLACLCALCVAILLLIPREKENPTEIEQAVRETLDALYKPTEATSPEIPTEPEETVPEETREPYISPIDFASLQAMNSDIYAWLYIPNTEISFPLVQNESDDTFYLNHDSEGNYYNAGAIFTEHEYNGTDFTDPVTIAYGHRMQSGAMFGELQRIYSGSDGMTDCSEIIVFLPERELHFTVFAAVPYGNHHILYNYDFSSKRMYGAFLDSVYSVRDMAAVFNYDVEVSTDDQLLILSTCLYGNSQKRYLVLAKCVEEIK